MKTQNSHPYLYEHYSLFVRAIAADDPLTLTFDEWVEEEFANADEAEAAMGLKAAIYAEADRHA